MVSLAEKVIQGSRPLIPPTMICTPLAQLIQDCWAQEPEKRPIAKEVLHRLKNIDPDSPLWDEDDENSADEEEISDMDSGESDEEGKQVWREVGPNEIAVVESDKIGSGSFGDGR